jgi:hypothetical protein
MDGVHGPVATGGPTPSRPALARGEVRLLRRPLSWPGLGRRATLRAWTKRAQRNTRIWPTPTAKRWHTRAKRSPRTAVAEFVATSLGFTKAVAIPQETERRGAATVVTRPAVTKDRCADGWYLERVAAQPTDRAVGGEFTIDTKGTVSTVIVLNVTKLITRSKLHPSVWPNYNFDNAPQVPPVRIGLRVKKTEAGGWTGVVGGGETEREFTSNVDSMTQIGNDAFEVVKKKLQAMAYVPPPPPQQPRPPRAR